MKASFSRRSFTELAIIFSLRQNLKTLKPLSAMGGEFLKGKKIKRLAKLGFRALNLGQDVSSIFFRGGGGGNKEIQV